ncbi:MAG: hypothetical protein M1827_001362 [Pycnora praestabilis]|nr:MAG: hypothetical protein M1827_001362 [Pycnora praestabilis]
MELQPLPTIAPRSYSHGLGINGLLSDEMVIDIEPQEEQRGNDGYVDEGPESSSLGSSRSSMREDGVISSGSRSWIPDLFGRMLSSPAKPEIADKRYSNIRIERGKCIFLCRRRVLIVFPVDSYPDGYPRLAALINSDPNFSMCRRFGTLRNRVLLHRQDELAVLEKKLNEMDRVHEKDNPYRLQSRKYDNQSKDPIRGPLIDEIDDKLKAYDDLLTREWKLRGITKPTRRNYRSLFNWVWNNKPLAEDETDFTFLEEDFVSLAHGQENSPFDGYVEDLIQKSPSRRLQRIFSTPELLMKTDDDDIHYYSKERLGILVKVTVALLSVALLMIPVFLLFDLNSSDTVKLVIVLLFVLIFPVAIAAFTNAKYHEIFAGTAGLVSLR